MGRHAGFVIVSAMALICIPYIAPACPAYDIISLGCNPGSSSIESCVNQIWYTLSNEQTVTKSPEERLSYPASNVTSRLNADADLRSSIRVFGEATDYSYRNGEPKCDASWLGIYRCKLSIGIARRGLDLLTQPVLVANLSATARERLRDSLRQHEVKFTAQLDLVAASGQADPAALCSKTYGIVASCERAVAADRIALRDQVFPAYNCGMLVPGKFLTAKDVTAEEAQRKADPTAVRAMLSGALTFEAAQAFFRDRLRQEEELLEKARRGQ